MPTNDIFYRPWDPKTDQDFDTSPCGKSCHHFLALDDCEGFTVWNCKHGSWIMPRSSELAEVHAPHEGSKCPGNCKTHPLINAYTLQSRELEDQGLSWGDIAERDLAANRACETAQQTAERLKKEAEAEAASMAGLIGYSVNKKADKWCSKGGQMKFRVPRPCKYESLFLARTCAGCGSQVPEGQTKCPATKSFGRICGEELAGCWAHEKSHNCIYVHSDEPQWSDALSGLLCYDRDRQCFHKRGDVLPAQGRDFTGLSGDKRSRPDSRDNRDSRDSRDSRNRRR